MINMRYFEASWVIVSIMALAMADLSLAQNSKQDYLDAHNEARAELGLRKLSWNDTVAAYAQSYADKRSADCELVHSEGPYGENLAMGSGELSAVDAVNLWVGEKKFYDHGSNTCLEGECGHYTQVVWKDTTQIGCARVECQNGWWFITCNYYPPGNFIGERPY